MHGHYPQVFTGPWSCHSIARVYSNIPRVYSGGIIWGRVVRRHVVWGRTGVISPRVWTVTSHSTLLAIGSDPLMVHEIVNLGTSRSRIDSIPGGAMSRSSLTDPMLSRAFGVGPKTASQYRTDRMGRSPFNRCRHFTRCTRARPLAGRP